MLDVNRQQVKYWLKLYCSFASVTRNIRMPYLPIIELKFPNAMAIANMPASVFPKK